jgi:hypothetical protein
MLFFELSAFVALMLLIRHSARVDGARETLRLFLYLAVMSVAREWLVWNLSLAIDKPMPFTSEAKLGRIGFINLVVVTGWMFTSFLSFSLAKMIQRRQFPQSNIFLTLSLTSIVANTIAYAVETTGMRLHLWTWNPTARSPVRWLPFDFPADGFEGWPATAFIMMFVWCALRYCLFTPVRWRNIAITLIILGIWAAADLTVVWFGPESPRKKLTFVMMLCSTFLGFAAPRRYLGTSQEALGAVPS